MSNILFFGDSLTAGYGLSDPSSQSYPALIEQKINAAGLPFHVINAGLSGDTSGGGLSRIDYWLSRPVDVFVLELGINDVFRQAPPTVTQKNLQAIIDRVRSKYPAAKTALMGMRLPDFLHSPLTPQFNSIYPALAQANQMAFVPFFLEGVAGKSNLNLRDKIHPSAEGYKIIAGNVWPVIRSLLVVS
jgi:acyl-CoA thioesterase-1